MPERPRHARDMLLLAPIAALALNGCAGNACPGRLSMEELTRSPCWEEGVSLWVRTVEGEMIRGRVEDTDVGPDSALALGRESDFSIRRIPLDSIEYAEVVWSSPAAGMLFIVLAGAAALFVIAASAAGPR